MKKIIRTLDFTTRCVKTKDGKYVDGCDSHHTHFVSNPNPWDCEDDYDNKIFYDRYFVVVYRVEVFQDLHLEEEYEEYVLLPVKSKENEVMLEGIYRS